MIPAKTEQESQAKIAIVVCTHNPKENYLRRTLCGIAALTMPHNASVECVIVDNRSDPPVADHAYVQTFLACVPWARIVREDRQGLTFARVRGLVETTGDIVVFFDDDNEPQPTYLDAVEKAFRQSPQVGVFGPGNIAVEFLDAVPRWVDESCRHFFQERHSAFTEYACIRTPWHSVYPAGTGQSVRRSIMERYAARVTEGSCTATGRKGQSLASGEDGQIVHTAVLMGFAAGVCPDMRVRHLIPDSRCTPRYLKRLAFGVAACLLPASVESFPELCDQGVYQPPSWARYKRHKWLAALRESLTEPAPLRCIHAAARVGDAVGRYLAAGRPVPSWLEREKQRLGLA